MHDKTKVGLNSEQPDVKQRFTKAVWFWNITFTQSQKTIHTVKSHKLIPWWWEPHVLINHAWLSIHSDCWSLKRNVSKPRLFMPLNILGVQSSVVRAVIPAAGVGKIYFVDTYSNISCHHPRKHLQSHLPQTPLRLKWTHPVEWSPRSN